MDVVEHRNRFEALYAAHCTAILGFAARRCRTAADAADATSEVFLVAWRRIADVPGDDEARLWLYGVARHVVANQRRSTQRRERLGKALLDAWTQASGPDPVDALVRSEDVNAVRAALATLRKSDVDLLTLVAWEGLTPAQAASVLEIKPATARARLSRARSRLHHRLGQPPATSQIPNPMAQEATS